LFGELFSEPRALRLPTPIPHAPNPHTPIPPNFLLTYLLGAAELLLLLLLLLSAATLTRLIGETLTHSPPRRAVPRMAPVATSRRPTALMTHLAEPRVHGWLVLCQMVVVQEGGGGPLVGKDHEARPGAVPIASTHHADAFWDHLKTAEVRHEPGDVDVVTPWRQYPEWSATRFSSAAFASAAAFSMAERSTNRCILTTSTPSASSS